MPKHAEIRDAIRDTWLKNKYWQFDSGRKIQTHHVFLLGTQEGVNLDEEEQKFGDLLQHDFIESHYNLTVKERASNTTVCCLTRRCPTVLFAWVHTGAKLAFLSSK